MSEVKVGTGVVYSNAEVEIMRGMVQGKLLGNGRWFTKLLQEFNAVRTLLVNLGGLSSDQDINDTANKIIMETYGIDLMELVTKTAITIKRG